MITDKGKYYLYRHTRCDKGTPFYIGIGSKSFRAHTTHVGEYYRAYTRGNRSDIWKRINVKTEVDIEILVESDDYEFIKGKEVEFIKLYGKVYDGGLLVNLTDGGDGTVGRRVDPLKNSLNKAIFQFSLAGDLVHEWVSGKQIEKTLGFASGSIYNCCNGKNTTAYNYQWSYENSPLSAVKRNDKGEAKPALQYSPEGALIKRWGSVKEAAQALGLHKSHISACCAGKRKSSGGYIWKY